MPTNHTNHTNKQAAGAARLLEPPTTQGCALGAHQEFSLSASEGRTEKHTFVWFVWFAGNILLSLMHVAPPPPATP